MMKHGPLFPLAFPIVILLAGLLPPTTALADSTSSLPPVVVTATMTKQNLDVAPGTVQVITKDEIDAMGAESVTDVLEQATGIVILTGAGRTQSASCGGWGPATPWFCWTGAESSAVIRSISTSIRFR
nr:TonB-dependent receptor plug domain-containing protein [Desulfosarcina cetonica]